MQSFKINPMIATDSYKLGHKDQYPEGTAMIYSNMTPRSGKILSKVVPVSIYDNKVVHFGVQGLLMHYTGLWQENFFDVPEEDAVNWYSNTVPPFVGACEVQTEHIRALHRLGYLPLLVRSLPEGSVIPFKIPVFTVENTLPEFDWLTNYTETYFSNEYWKGTTVATIARYYRILLEKYAEETGCPKEFVDFQAHDFSCRGMSGMHDSATSGGGHLVYFKGSDTLLATDYLKYAYNASKEPLIACSVPATEHSVATSMGREGEFELFKRIITEVVPNGIVSVVSDSFDFWQVMTDFTVRLKDDILARGKDPITGLSKVVFRPDCYDDKTEILTQRGFVLFSELLESDLVAQVDDIGCYSFVKPTETVVQNYTGEMVSFKDKKGKIDLLVTPNHRMIVQVNGKEKVILAEEMLPSGHDYQKMFRSAKQQGNLSELTPLEKLKIAFQADGSFVTKSSNSIRFSFSKQRKIERLKQILADLNYEFSEYDLSDGKKEINAKVSSDLFQKNLDWVNVSEISSSYAQAFIEEVSYWDATRRTEKRFKFDSTNKSVAEKVQLIAIAAGYGALLTNSQDDRKEQFSDIYTVHIMKDNTVGGQSWVKSSEQYSGKVYCVKVPTGKLIVKRNRSILVCGNSGDPVEIVCGTSCLTFTDFEDAIDEICDIHFAEAREGCEGSHNIGCEYYSTVAKVGEKYYNFATRFEYNRHDKTYYYIDNYGDAGETKYQEVQATPEMKGAIECLWDVFGGTINEKGYKVLSDRVGLIYGDSITLERAEAILKGLKDKGFCTSCIVFGVGSFTYQYMTRDTLGLAIKATYRQDEDGVGYDIFKDPKTDDGTKKSAKGLLQVVLNESGEYELKDQVTYEAAAQHSELKTVLVNGCFVNPTDLTDIRERAKIS